VSPRLQRFNHDHSFYRNAFSHRTTISAVVVNSNDTSSFARGIHAALMLPFCSPFAHFSPFYFISPHIRSAVVVNPNDTGSFARGIHAALTRPVRRRIARQRWALDHVHTHTAQVGKAFSCSSFHSPKHICFPFCITLRYSPLDNLHTHTAQVGLITLVSLYLIITRLCYVRSLFTHLCVSFLQAWSRTLTLYSFICFFPSGLESLLHRCRR
jgi:hypothetical protein